MLESCRRFRRNGVPPHFGSGRPCGSRVLPTGEDKSQGTVYDGTTSCSWVRVLGTMVLFGHHSGRNRRYPQIYEMSVITMMDEYLESPLRYENYKTGPTGTIS